MKLKFKNHARVQQNVNKVPFKEIFPLRLKNYVLGKSQKNTSGSCLFEMSLVFTCWKENGYVSSACKHLEQQLNSCFYQYLENSAKQKELGKHYIPEPKTKNLTNKQLSYMLHLYPNI